MAGPVSQQQNNMNFLNAIAEAKRKAESQDKLPSVGKKQTSSVNKADNVAVINKKNTNNGYLRKRTIAERTGIVANVLASVFLVTLIGLMLSTTIKMRHGGKIDLKKYLKTIENLNMPDAVREKVVQEAKKLSFLGTQEAAKVKSYIDEVLKLSWIKPERKLVNLDQARKILDRDHVGLEKVKHEVIEFLSMENYRIKNDLELNEPLMICMSGPPGTGKTSIAESIAEAMDRPFAKISLGGANEKSYIKGNQRVYIGSEPGKIVKAFQNTGVSNPVILLDEIDKMGDSVRHGDPASALLDVLESKQCKTFVDDYMGIPYDLSNAVFVITSNDLSRIPEPLKDRIKIIDISGYTAKEKISISELVIRNLRETFKMGEDKLEFTSQGIKQIIDYDNSEGVRKTISNLKSIFKNVIHGFETGKIKGKFVVDENQARTILASSGTSPKREIGFKFTS